MTYYVAVNICLLVALLLFSILVHENDRLTPKAKRFFYLTYILIGVAASVEWIGLAINGNTNISSVLLRIIKCLDYILTPAIGFTFILQMNFRNIIHKIMFWTIAANTLFQIVSAFTGWMTVIDANNFYSHGILYPVYIAVYLSIAILVLVEFALYGRSFRKQNRLSLYLALGLVAVGVALQEIFGGEIRTSYLALVLGSSALFIHTSEFTQQEADETIEKQTIQITRDALTGLKSRYAYSQALTQGETDFPKDAAVFSIDINGLKEINDKLGHIAGDELIVGAASCIEKVFPGDAYRTGGDEFVILTRMSDSEAKSAINQLTQLAKDWHGKEVQELHFAIGYALKQDHEEAGPEELVKLADRKMYAAKEKYYVETGKDRRFR